jgi:hypothetical protein
MSVCQCSVQVVKTRLASYSCQHGASPDTFAPKNLRPKPRDRAVVILLVGETSGEQEVREGLPFEELVRDLALAKSHTRTWFFGRFNPM